jgi:5-methylcytosine-specific restriction endonuclease McrA
MISIATPSDSAQEVYAACAEGTKNLALKKGLKAEAVRVGQRSQLYLSKAAAEELYLLNCDNAQNVSNAELANLYERALLKSRIGGTYELIKSLPRLARCPLCGQRDVKTLDHYLPRASFPELSVTPANLVPCCSDCNKAKLDFVPDLYEKQSFHPYFDDWSGVILLLATPAITDRVDITFSINPNLPNPPKWIRRAKWHFQLFDLGRLYSENAAVELVQRKAGFKSIYLAAGASGLKEDLSFEAQSRAKPFPNAWQPALYRGLSASAEFCEGGFEKIED